MIDIFTICAIDLKVSILIQTSQDPSSPLGEASSTIGASLNMNVASNTLAVSKVNDGRDGWENDEWGSLEEEPTNEELEEKENENHLTASRSNSNSQSHSSSAVSNNNGGNNISPTKNNGSGGADTLKNSSSNSNSNWENYGSAWNDDEFEPIDEPGAGVNCHFS